jgi:hypothetical protein
MASIRENMRPIARGARAYFAPVGRATESPAVFDPVTMAALDLDHPPAPWIDLGWVENVKHESLTTMGAVSAGALGAVQQQFRAALKARVSVEFREWGKLQMALAGGSQHMNLLAEADGAAAVASGGAAAAPVAVVAGSSATEIVVGAGHVSAFDVGDLIAVDVDYSGQTGYVGTGVAGAYVRNVADVNSNADYIRRVTFNVAKIASKTANSVVLESPLIGGVPAAGARAQKVVGFVDREGGAFFHEWSAVLVVTSQTGARICWHYPRLQVAKRDTNHPVVLSEKFQLLPLLASFEALPVKDSNDGELALCYRSFIPATNAPAF